MPNIGPLEIAIVLVVMLLAFGPKRLPQLGRSAGKGIREFRSSVNDVTRTIPRMSGELEPSKRQSS